MAMVSISNDFKDKIQIQFSTIERIVKSNEVFFKDEMVKANTSITAIEKTMQEIKETFFKIEKEEELHFYKCPIHRDIEDIHTKIKDTKKELQTNIDTNQETIEARNKDLDFFLRHPFLAVIAVAIICGITLFWGSKWINEVNAAIGVNKSSIEQTEKAVAPLIEKERKSIMKGLQNEITPR